MIAWKYASGNIFVILTVAAILIGGPWAFSVPFAAFVVVPIVEFLWGASEINVTPDEERQRLAERLYDLLLYLTLPSQWFLVLLLMWRVSLGDMGFWHWFGATWSLGIMCGTLGINVAHELGHRKTLFEQRLAKALLASTTYMHFFIEHNKGHHANVATEEDPASAKLGETVYQFWPRSVIGSYRSAWEIENRRLAKQGKPVLSLRNEMIQFHVIQGAIITGIGLAFGWLAMVSFLLASLHGALLLETINYVEHYGLTRKRKDNGKYEKVLPCHSWNSDYLLGRIMLFELTRHSDHHANPNRKYQVLRHFDRSPQLPTGYAGMVVMSLFPPLYFSLMNRQIARFQSTWTEEEARRIEAEMPDVA